MSTTNLFVELLVIGVGALIWIVLLILAVFGYHWIPDDLLKSPVMAVPALAIVYVLGILSDRLADTCFEKIWNDDLRDEFFKHKKDYYDARRLILTKSERLSELLEYGRSRLRICRGWVFNTVLIIVCFNLFVWVRVSEPSILNLLFINVFLVLFLSSAWFSWKKLVLTEYRKIKEQSAFISSNE